jgi:hypothetical protein
LTFFALYKSDLEDYVFSKIMLPDILLLGSNFAFRRLVKFSKPIEVGGKSGAKNNEQPYTIAPKLRY